MIAPAWMTSHQRAVYTSPVMRGRVRIPASSDGCWPWTAGRSEKGYGRVRLAGRHWYAHRLSFYLATGSEPEAVCHGCDNPPCVNPEHLRAGSLADNTAEMWSKGRARVHYANALLLDGGLEMALDALRFIGPPRSKGRNGRVASLAASLGVSIRTVYRLMSPSETPLVYRSRIAKRTHQPPEEIAA